MKLAASIDSSRSDVSVACSEFDSAQPTERALFRSWSQPSRALCFSAASVLFLRPRLHFSCSPASSPGTRFRPGQLSSPAPRKRLLLSPSVCHEAAPETPELRLAGPSLGGAPGLHRRNPRPARGAGGGTPPLPTGRWPWGPGACSAPRPWQRLRAAEGPCPSADSSVPERPRPQPFPRS